MKSTIDALLRSALALHSGAVQTVTDLISGETAFLDRYADALFSEGDEYVAYSVTAGRQAVITVDGVLVHKLGMQGGFWGFQGYDGLERQVLLADQDEGVDEIVFDLHSPGGTVYGVEEAARVISSAEKPTVALVNEQALSAGYWLACACDRIVALPASDVGSVGVISIHENAEGYYEAMGIDHTVFKAGQMKDQGSQYRGVTSQEAQEWQADIDRIYARFVAWVADRRGITAEAVRETEARVYPAEQAIGLGLVDEISTKDQVLEAPGPRGSGFVGQSQGDFEMAKPEGRDQAALDETALAEAQATWERQAAADQKAAIAAAVAEALANKEEEISADKARVSAVMALDEAKGKEAMASKLAEFGLDAEQAKAALELAPKSYSAVMDEEGGAGAGDIEPEPIAPAASANISVVGM